MIRNAMLLGGGTAKEPFSNEVQFTTAGLTTFTVPRGVTELKALVIGGGGLPSGRTGGKGGGVISGTFNVTPGDVLQINVGAVGTNSSSIYYLNSDNILVALGGTASQRGATQAHSKVTILSNYNATNLPSYTGRGCTSFRDMADDKWLYHAKFYGDDWEGEVPWSVQPGFGADGVGGAGGGSTSGSNGKKGTDGERGGSFGGGGGGGGGSAYTTGNDASAGNNGVDGTGGNGGWSYQPTLLGGNGGTGPLNPLEDSLITGGKGGAGVTTDANVGGGGGGSGGSGYGGYGGKGGGNEASILYRSLGGDGGDGGLYGGYGGGGGGGGYSHTFNATQTRGGNGGNGGYGGDGGNGGVCPKNSMGNGTGGNGGPGVIVIWY